jgi:hypothetical protein
MDASAQGDEVESPGEVENPGEHRASGGINTRPGNTNSRGEKGPEDEPISHVLHVFVHHACGPSGLTRENGGYPV